MRTLQNKIKSLILNRQIDFIVRETRNEVLFMKGRYSYLIQYFRLDGIVVKRGRLQGFRIVKRDRLRKHKDIIEYTFGVKETLKVLKILFR